MKQVIVERLVKLRGLGLKTGTHMQQPLNDGIVQRRCQALIGLGTDCHWTTGFPPSLRLERQALSVKQEALEIVHPFPNRDTFSKGKIDQFSSPAV